MMNFTITPPRGTRARTRRELEAAGASCTDRECGQLNITIPCGAGKEPAARVAELVRSGVQIRITRISPPHADDQRAANDLVEKMSADLIARLLARPDFYTVVTVGKYVFSTLRLRRALAETGQDPRGYTLTKDEIDLPRLLDRVGPAGEQARADEARYFETWREQASSRRVNVAEIDTVDAAPGCTAVLVTRHIYTLYHLRLRSSSVECHLVVRDSTTGERHVLRVPPKFGARVSVTRQKLLAEGGPAAVVHAATAWTFGLRPEEYHPGAEA